MSAPKGKALTHAQRKAATTLLREQADRLWGEWHQKFGVTVHTFDKQARREWEDAHPEFMAVSKKARKYLERAEKRMAKFAAEAAEAAEGVEWTYTHGISLYKGLPTLSPSSVPHPGVRVPWQERAVELSDEFLKRKLEAHATIVALIARKEREIVLATLGDVPEALYSLPTLSEILDGTA